MYLEDYEEFDEAIDENDIYPGYYQEYLDNYQDFPSKRTWKILFNECIQPVLFGDDIMFLLCSMLIMCLFQRIVANLSFLPRRWMMLSGGLLGVLLVLTTQGLATISALMTLFVIVLSIIHYYHKRQNGQFGWSLLATSILFVLVLQWKMPSKNFTQIRGSLLILLMKVVSFGFDSDSDSALFDDPFWPVAIFGYFFDVGSVLFGPWMPIGEHLRLISRKTALLNQLKAVLYGLLKLAISLGFLLYSSCFIECLIPDGARYLSPWLIAYRDAQSYRTSHYFVSFLAETSILLTVGFRFCGSSVSNPLSIEMPRSLVQVVINWNIPMHKWLRIYVFKNCRPFGKFLAVFLTYLCSSFLHGLNFQLSAVLLSLGFYTYSEHGQLSLISVKCYRMPIELMFRHYCIIYINLVLREKLARVYNSCIRARTCPDDCGHIHKSTLLVHLTNAGFLCLSIFHLAYLGMPFTNVQSQEEGYNYRHTIQMWGSVHFASHLVAILTFYFAISI